VIWEWTSTQIARIQTTDPRRIPTDWLVRPCFKTWPRTTSSGNLVVFGAYGFLTGEST
jgi:hypothetical protein